MRKTLYIIGLSTLIFSCAAKKKTVASTYRPKIASGTTKTVGKSDEEAAKKPQIKTQNGVEFYSENIANAANNDNTASYGSIVSAKPQGYRVVKTYFPSLGQNFRQRYLILHYTALDDSRSLTALTQKSVSAHYLVNNLGDNEIYQLVDENKRAYHAGISTWRSDKNLNDNSVGIEIVNIGYTADATGKKTFLPYSDEQVKKVAALAKDIVDRYQIPPTNVLAHSDIAPTRKQDPGPLFPWKKLYDEYQIGMWYDEPTKQNFYNLAMTDFAVKYDDPAFIFSVKTNLQKFGYGLELSEKWDDATKRTIEAFQYHFRPTNYDGIMDAETWAILQALIQKYPTK
ncbi:N-acetylmuramoyl-L-alanine amidase [Chryseobacterium sp. Leaf404]|uniref:N-acetylmuramoyl-L-alanine amidase n=1 Tax=unclassified Chryseobacterium TaxID=2593645 RepID=UPI0006F2AA9D|nr:MULTISPECIES: N-acetylmuramoyl-L-alanine amidase [unclassified Chryseobacterium]KQT20902.1 N-acetylmuramoyl-L-alanine amidase [Chryseobacterium sp. Leaf404]